MTPQRNFRRTVLPSGLIVLTVARMNICLGGHGRVDQVLLKLRNPPEINGISHFVEHMVFKGTRSRSSSGHRPRNDPIGGNPMPSSPARKRAASTSSRSPTTCSSLLTCSPTWCSIPSSLLPKSERERGVILEEIKIDEDNPDVLVHELFTQNFWERPSTRQTNSRHHQNSWAVFLISRNSLTTTHGSFRGGNMVFSAAGNLEHKISLSKP